MGNTQSPPTDPRFNSATRAFTQTELSDLKSLFTSLAAQSNSDSRFISPKVFKAHIGLTGPLANRLFHLITPDDQQQLTYEQLVIAKATYEKGTNDEIDEFIYQLLHVNGDGCLDRPGLESALMSTFDHIFQLNASEAEMSSHKESIEVFLNAATFSRDDNQSGQACMSFDDFRNWCRLVPSARKFLGSLLTAPDPGNPGCQVPQLVYSEDIDSNMILLRKEYAWHIGGALSQHELEEWKLLYHSAFNGLSYNTFLDNISKDEGPTVLIIKDKEGYVYGGYASQPWERHGDFYGDMKSFIFQLNPIASIYKPTGANTNIQWCAVNFSSESIPNGVGFGGRASHFGLFLSAGLDQGHSQVCTTFGSPCLSKTNRMQPDVIECWGVSPKSQQEKQNAVNGSVLERFKEDRNMLKLIGLANSSE